MKPVELERELIAKLNGYSKLSKEVIDELCDEYVQKAVSLKGGSQIPIEFVREQFYDKLGAKRSKRQANLRPTPPIGYSVQWLDGANVNKPCAARVVGINGPSNVSLEITFLNGHRIIRGTVKHIDDPVFLNPNNEVGRNEGAWRYIPGDGPNAEHYATDAERERHRQQAAEKSQRDKEALERARQQEQQLAEESLEPTSQ